VYVSICENNILTVFKIRSCFLFSYFKEFFMLCNDYLMKKRKEKKNVFFFT